MSRIIFLIHTSNRVINVLNLWGYYLNTLRWCSTMFAKRRCTVFCCFWSSNWYSHLINTFNWPHACMANTAARLQAPTVTELTTILDISCIVNAILFSGLCPMSMNLLYVGQGNTITDTLTLPIYSNVGVMPCNRLCMNTPPCIKTAHIPATKRPILAYFSITCRSSLFFTVCQSIFICWMQRPIWRLRNNREKKFIPPMLQWLNGPIAFNFLCISVSSNRMFKMQGRTVKDIRE